jgi:hypothetical protein
MMHSKNPYWEAAHYEDKFKETFSLHEREEHNSPVSVLDPRVIVRKSLSTERSLARLLVSGVQVLLDRAEIWSFSVGILEPTRERVASGVPVLHILIERVDEARIWP